MSTPRFHDGEIVGLYGWVLRYAAHRWIGLTGVLTAIGLKIALDLLKPWPMKVLLDYVLLSRSMPGGLSRMVHWLPASASREGLLAWCIAFTILIFVASWVLDLLSAFANISFARRIDFDVAGDLFAHLQRLSLRFHSRQSVGDLLRRVTSDCGFVSIVINEALLPVFGSVVSLIAMFLVMWQMEPTLTMLSLTVVPFMLYVLRRYSKQMEETSCRQHDAEGQVYALVEQTLSSIPVVQAFGQEEQQERRFRKGASNILAATLSATHVQFKFKILIGTATAVGTSAILWLGTYRALQGSFTVGNIMVFLSYLSSLYGPLQALIYAPNTIHGAKGSARRVVEMLEIDHEVTDRAGAIAIPPLKGHVRVEGVMFGYDPERPILKDVSLEALPGQTVAIVGPTGAGKSTLVSLVPRFFDPWGGRVTVDGYDLRDVQLRSLREQIAIVLQDPFLFPMSIADNIAYGRPGATRAQAEAAAAAANADAFIRELPNGYDTVIGERGATLSGGQRQRISIARALLKDAPVLILDEPTSALDAQTESLLLDAFRRLAAGRTTLIIAHRLSTIRAADKIVVLKDGRVEEEGSHAELLSRAGLYAQLYRTQFGEPADNDNFSSTPTLGLSIVTEPTVRNEEPLT